MAIYSTKKYIIVELLITLALAFSVSFFLWLTKQENLSRELSIIHTEAAPSKYDVNCRLGISFQRGGEVPSSSMFKQMVDASKSIKACSQYQSIYWDQVEKKPGEMTGWGDENPADLLMPTGQIKALTDAGIEPIGRLWMTPVFYSSAPKEVKESNLGKVYSRFYSPQLSYIPEWVNFVGSAVKKYDSSINIWLLYHEPQQALYYQTPKNKKHPITNANDRKYKDYEDANYHFYIDQRYGAATIKEKSPGDLLYFTGFSPFHSGNSPEDQNLSNFFDNYLRYPGTRTSFDIVRDVTYIYSNPKEICRNKDGTVKCEISKNLTDRIRKEIKERVRVINSMLSERGIRGKPLFAETGVNSDINNNQIIDNGEQNAQAEILNLLISSYLDNGIRRLTIFRLMNSERLSPLLAEDQKDWVTLGLFNLGSDTGSYILDYNGEPTLPLTEEKGVGNKKNAADTFAKLASLYNKNGDTSIFKVNNHRYTLSGGPCEHELKNNCIFDGREVYIDDNGDLWEIISVRSYIYTAKYNTSNPTWSKQLIRKNLESQESPIEFCDYKKDLPCFADTISLRKLDSNNVIFSYTAFNKKFGVTMPLTSGSKLVNTKGSSNLVILNDDIKKYASTNGPCQDLDDRECYNNTRTFDIVNGLPVEVITRGDIYYEFSESNNKWFKQPLSQHKKYSGLNNSPCKNRKYCVWDTHSIWSEKDNTRKEEVTLGNLVFSFDSSNKTWSKKEL